jgi:hypothetical protein
MTNPEHIEIGDGEVIDILEIGKKKNFIFRADKDPWTADMEPFKDPKGKPILIGSSVRISEEGRKAFPESVLLRHPNLRSKVVFISKRGVIFIEAEGDLVFAGGNLEVLPEHIIVE